MRKTILKPLLAIVCLLSSITLYAHDFKVDGIYYNITSETDKTVEVTSNENYYVESVVIVIPETVTYQGATYSVTSIGDGAFYLCEGLTEVTIGNSVTSIGEWAFAYCEGLTKMRIEAVNPPAIYDNTFEWVDKSIPLYVPAESVEAYRTADYWEYFINVLEDLSNSAVEDITSDNSDTPAEYYDLNGFRVNNPTHGIYIMKQGNTVRKVVL